MSPIAKMPGTVVSNFSVSTGIRLPFELQAPIGDRAELHRQPEERQHRVALTASRPSLPLTLRR